MFFCCDVGLPISSQRTRRILEKSFQSALKKHHTAIYTKYGLVYVTLDHGKDVLASSIIAGRENYEPYVDPDDLYDAGTMRQLTMTHPLITHPLMTHDTPFDDLYDAGIVIVQITHPSSHTLS